jgi:hypothetical protein
MSVMPPAAEVVSNLIGFVPGQLSPPDACAAQIKLRNKRDENFMLSSNAGWFDFINARGACIVWHIAPVKM